jgi:hypothetical protein
MVTLSDEPGAPVSKRHGIRFRGGQVSNSAMRFRASSARVLLDPSDALVCGMQGERNWGYRWSRLVS